MEYSKQLKKIAIGYEVPVQTLIMADLVLAGYGEDDAYGIAYAQTSVLSADKQLAQRQRIVADYKYQRILKERGHGGTEDMELMDTDSALKALLAQIQKMGDGKEKADLYAKYLESMRKTNAAPDDEDSRVQIYLPLKCRECELYCNYVKNGRKNQLNPKIPQ